MTIAKASTKFLRLITIIMMTLGTAQAQRVAEKIQPPPNADVNYALGYNLGRSLNNQHLQALPAEILRGLKDALAGREGHMLPTEVGQILTDYYSIDRRRAKAAEVDANRQAGTHFLDQNARRRGVTVLPSGLQYEVLKTGNGRKPAATDTVLIHQQGQRLDGFVITDTRQRGYADQVPQNLLLPGVAEAVRKMSAGDRWKLYIPATLGFGETGYAPMTRGPVVLIWDLELLQIQPSEDEKNHG